MAKTKTTKPTKPTKPKAGPKKPNTKSPAEAGEELDLADIDLSGSPLGAEEKTLLITVSRFLFAIVEPFYWARASREGFTKDDLKQMWSRYETGAGRYRPLVDNLASLEGDPERLRVLGEVDHFENLWFPRFRSIIERHAAKPQVNAFLAEFFKDLVQQPLGPGLLNSVPTLIARAEGLAKSKWEGADKVLATARQRGFTSKKIGEVMEKVESLRAVMKEPEKPGKDHVDAAKAQLEALEDLALMFKDWGTHLRPSFNIPQQVHLGLTTPRGGPGGGTTKPAEEPKPAGDPTKPPA